MYSRASTSTTTALTMHASRETTRRLTLSIANTASILLLLDLLCSILRMTVKRQSRVPVAG